MAVIGMEPEFDRRYFDEDAIDLCKSTWAGLDRAPCAFPPNRHCHE